MDFSLTCLHSLSHAYLDPWARALARRNEKHKPSLPCPFRLSLSPTVSFGYWYRSPLCTNLMVGSVVLLRFIKQNTRRTHINVKIDEP